jgi:hypothetical protein
MLVKFEINIKSNEYTSVAVYEYNPYQKKFNSFPSMVTGSQFIEFDLSEWELKYYNRYKKSHSKRGFYYGVWGNFRNPRYQHILGTA